MDTGTAASLRWLAFFVQPDDPDQLQRFDAAAADPDLHPRFEFDPDRSAFVVVGQPAVSAGTLILAHPARSTTARTRWAYGELIRHPFPGVR